jgi:hypothetical protein
MFPVDLIMPLGDVVTSGCPDPDERESNLGRCFDFGIDRDASLERFDDHVVGRPTLGASHRFHPAGQRLGKGHGQRHRPQPTASPIRVRGPFALTRFHRAAAAVEGRVVAA